MVRRRARPGLAPGLPVQLPLASREQLPIGQLARHSRDATATVLLARIERAAERSPRVLLDLRGEIAQVATSWQAQDLLFVERLISRYLNPNRERKGQPAIELGYCLPEVSPAIEAPGLIDLARLRLHEYLDGLTPAQRTRLAQLGSPAITTGGAGVDDDEDSPEQGEVALLPLYRVEATPGTIDPLVEEIRRQLGLLLVQGLPGISPDVNNQIVTFVEEAASNIREHAGGDLPLVEGFVAANRTRRRYRDRKRDQWVEVYTTYLSCYDLGRGIYPALASVPSLARVLALCPEVELGIAGLRLATQPGVTSRADGLGGGGGLGRMVNIVRTLGEIGGGGAVTYRGGLQLASGGAMLDLLSSSERATRDRPLPGTQLRLRFEAIARTSI